MSRYRAPLRCYRCGRSPEPGERGGRCDPCLLADRVAVVFDDGTGRVSPALHPLAALLSASPEPRAAYYTLRADRTTAKLLGQLATGDTELSHEGLDAYGSPKATSKVRNMLVAAGLLPAVDQTLLDFDRFVRQQLRSLTDYPHYRLLQQFATWHQLPRMRAKAGSRALTYGALNYAQQQFRAAQTFLTWLADQHSQSDQLTQAALDAWMLHAGRADSERIRGFLTWAMDSRRLPRLTVYVVPPRQREPVTQQERLDHLRRLATDDTIRLSARVIAILVLLYAQPLSRVRTLTLDDIIIDSDDEVHIGLGLPRSPVPQPFGNLLLRLANERQHPKSAAYAEQRWLFPGRNPGQPIHYIGLRKQLSSVGIPPRSTRIAALRQLVLDVPAPVVATALGFHQTTTHRQNRNVGGVWNRYAASPH